MPDWLLRLWKQLCPLRQADDELYPPAIKTQYHSAVASLSSAGSPADDEDIRSLAQRLYDEGAHYRDSVDTRAGVVVGAAGAVATLSVGLGGGLLPRYHGLVRILVLLPLYLVTLLYLAGAVYAALSAQKGIRLHIAGPLDVVPSPASGTSYKRQVAAALVGHAVENYKPDREKGDWLLVAHRCLRNGIYLVLFGGILLSLPLLFS